MRKLSYALLSLIVVFLIAGCDYLTPTEENRIAIESIDFNCVESPNNILRCTANVTGGDNPLNYIWTASFFSARTGVNASIQTFDYTDICLSTQRNLSVDISLEVRDGRGETAGPINKPFLIC